MKIDIKTYLDSLPEFTEEISISRMRLTTYVPNSITRFTRLKILYCCSNRLRELPLIPLPPSLAELWCYNNLLTKLPPLPPYLKRLDCGHNILCKLPPLPPTLTELVCVENILDELPPLPPQLEKLVCYSNNIATLPPLPPTLKELYCNKNPITTLPPLPPTLQLLYCRDIMIKILPILPPSLTQFCCSGLDLPYPCMKLASVRRVQRMAELYYSIKFGARWLWLVRERVARREGHPDRMFECVAEVDGDMEAVF